MSPHGNISLAESNNQSNHKKCIEIRYSENDKIACGCNANDCDSGLEFNWPAKSNEFIRVTSSKIGDRFKITSFVANESLGSSYKSVNETDNIDKLIIQVKINEHYQRVTGFGGALTDSASSLIMQLDEPVKQKLLNDYFGPTGLDYNLARIAIGGTDMSSRPYTYDDLNKDSNDFGLEKFSLQKEDLDVKIPLINHINGMRAKRNLPPLKLMAACWSPPAWMKDNEHLVQGNLKMQPGQELKDNPYYATYAKYIVRFIQDYELKHNITLWALSPQNEPRSPRRAGPKVIHHNSVNFSPEQLVAFYKYHLLPQLKLANYSSDKLHQFVWDDVYEDIHTYLSALFSEPTIRENITGVALHWYSQGIRDIPFSGVERVFNELPYRYSMISTEASYLRGQKPGDWTHGAGYARDLIRTLRTGFIGWIDWNLALDKTGGPTWANNPLDSAIQIDQDTQSYIKNPMYYALAHVVRFVKPNSTVVDLDFDWTNSTTTQQQSTDKKYIHAIAAEMDENMILKDGHLARRISLVLHNSLNDSRHIQLDLPDCKLKQNHRPIELELPANSIESFAFIC